jgi:steroid 5-alpha reductase family enzyme
MSLHSWSKTRALALTALVYCGLIAIAIAVFSSCDGWHPLWATLLTDFVTTAIIFGISCLIRNGSLYDAYWSTAPILIAWGFAVRGDGVPGLRVAIVLIAVSIWGVRLTTNWARGWPGFHHEDWRYTQMRADTGMPWWLNNLTVVHVFPTLQVWAGCIGMYAALTLGTRDINALDAVGVLLIVGGAIIELVADEQLRAHRRSSSAPCRRGLWSLARHPNYFGELCAWWGMWTFGAAGHPATWWWTLVGPLTMTILLRTASVPMMDKRSLARRPGYDALMNELPAILPLGRRIFVRN